ncbi:MAG: oxidoreductase [Propionibacteriales bacterium]|nr:oxidoreductase [Propionibacteriales bacterium]
MKHRVVILGAGYAGLPAARRLANQVRSDEVEVTVVSSRPTFLERPRLHQLSAGQRLRTMPLARYLEPAGARLVIDTVTGIDLDARVVTLDGQGPVRYDTLVYALGSTTDVDRVPGVAEHAHAFVGASSAERLREQAGQVNRAGGTFVVCGGGLTGIETAAEIAQSYPRLSMHLVAPRPPGHWLSSRAQAHVGSAFERLGVEVHTGRRVSRVDDGALVFDDGTSMPFDGCAWTGGFTVWPLARDAGLAVDSAGRILVDERLRSTSHRNVYAIGDAAAASGEWGDSLAMGCRSGGFTGPYVADGIATALSGRTPKPFGFRYFHECISLGRGDGVIQFLNADESPKRAILTGRLAARYKEVVLSSAAWLFHLPGPYVPRPRRRVAVSPTAARVGVSSG